ncbi:MAG: hypothetical protein AAGB93_00520 [Planctomycetota bacterium]
MTLIKSQLDALTGEIESIVVEATGTAGDYAREFASYVAGFVASTLIEPNAELGLARLEAQSMAVAETVHELGDQAAREAVIRSILSGARLLLAVSSSAP